MKQKPTKYSGDIKVGQMYRIKSDNNILEVVEITDKITMKYTVSETKKGVLLPYDVPTLERDLKFGLLIRL